MANARTKPDAASPCTCLRLRKAARRVSQIYDRHLEAHGLTITQYALLAHVQMFDGIGVGLLADKLVMDPTTLTRNLQPLLRQGWITLQACTRDKRARTLHLTPTGAQIVQEAQPSWECAQCEISEALGETDNAALAQSVDRLLDALTETGRADV